MKDHYNCIVAASERAAEWIFRNQKTKPADDTDLGAYFDPEIGYAEASVSGNCMAILVSLYCCPESKYFRDAEILDRALSAGHHLARHQHADGAWDLRGSNFHDTTSAAFILEAIVPAYRLLSRCAPEDAAASGLAALIRGVCLKAGKTLLEGGFHTPNHRWVVAAAVSLLYGLTGESKYKDMASRYLAEGIDINADGAYAEKSVGIYDAVADRALLTVVDELGRVDLIPLIQRNLRMIPYFLQPDGTLFTANSRRQDRSVRILPIRYYPLYLSMAERTGDGWYASYAQMIGDAHLAGLNSSGPQVDFLSGTLLRNKPAVVAHQSERTMAEDYHVHLSETGLVRIRCGDTVLTLLEGNEIFLHMQRGSLSGYLRLYASFFARGQFKSGPIVKTAKGYRMAMTVRYGYIQPLPLDAAAGPAACSRWEDLPHGTWADVRRFNTKGLYPAWENIDHGERGTANVQELRFTVDVEPFPDAVEPPSGIAASIRIRVEGTDRVPCKLEFVLDPGGMLVSPFCAQRGRSGGSIFLRSLGTDGSHEWTYTKGLDSFRFAGIPGGTPPFHGFDAVDTPMEERLRGEADADAQGYSIYIGSHTPFAGGIDIR